MIGGHVDARPVAAIVFDMTGVITQSPLEAIAAYSVGAGVAPESVLRHFRGHAFRQVLLGEKAMDDLVADITEDVERVEGVVLQAEGLRAAMRAGQQIAPDTAALVGELSAYRLAVLTNNTTDVVDVTEEGVAWWSDASGSALSPRNFSLIMASSEIGRVKPDIEIYRELLRRLDLPGEEVIYVDDQAANLRPAAELGMRTIHFRDAATCRSQLLDLGVHLDPVATEQSADQINDFSRSPMEIPINLSTLMTIRLKGRMTAEAVAQTTGAPIDEATNSLERGVEAGALLGANGRYKITPAGRELLARLVDEERSTIDAARLGSLYETFDEHNTALKQIVTDWQLRPDGSLNDHDDTAYDAVIVDRLLALDRAIQPWLDDLRVVAPRLARYAVRLSSAAEAVGAGDLTYVARPVADSYHTVWFELHEELMALTGRDRVAEATAGRAD